MQEQFTILHNSVSNISTDKQMGDKLQHQIQLLQDGNSSQASQICELREQMTRIITERDQFRQDTAELQKNKKIIEKHYAIDKVTSKDREAKLQKQVTELNKENADNMDEIITLQKSCKQLAMDKEKSKIRI